MEDHMGKVFTAFVRPIQELQSLLEADPYAEFKLKPGAKRVITFLGAKPSASPQTAD